LLYRVLAMVVALVVAGATSAFAAEKPSFAPPPAWVELAAVPPPPPADGAAAVQTLLDDNQSRLGTDAGDVYYNRRVRKILRPEGLPGLTTYRLTWSPDTESLAIHSLRIIRDGKVIDLLEGGKHMLVLRRETELERLTLDGRMTASQQIEGLQVGDILDYSFTLTRRDPVFEGHSYDSEGMDFAGPVARYRVRISWPEGANARWKATPGFGEPAVSHHDGRTWLEVDERGVEAPKAPVGAPLRFRRLGSLETSGFQSWREVSRLMWPHFAKSATLAPDSPVRAEAAAIAARTADPRERAFAALQLVEDKTRYFLIAIGEGGYVPATADQTWTRKFGDCKGKTVLLLALLKELGVAAEPVLVSLGAGDGLNERPPSMAAFNHVLIRAPIGGKVYWLDGTRTGDMSGLGALNVPDYRWGLPLRNGGAELERIVVPPPSDPMLDSLIRLDASQGLDAPAPVKMAMRMHGDAATALRQVIARAPKADLERSLRQSLSSSMSWIDVEKIAWRDDAAHDGLELDVTGKADMDWRKNPDLGLREYRVVASSTQPGGYPRREPGPNRDAPFAVPYPLFVRSLVEIVLPNGGRGFSVRGPNGTETIGGLQLNRESSLKDGVASFLVESRSVTQEISASEAEAATKALRRLAGEDSLVRAPS
jgi:transglutaminase-like putative cysteine protease